MTRATFRVLFYIRRTQILKDGTAPVYVRITVNRQRAEFGVQKSIEMDQWDSQKGCAKGYSSPANQLNSYLETIKAQLYQHKMVLSERGEVLTAYKIKNAYLGIDDDNKTILEVFREHNKRCKSLINIDFAQGTYDRYNTCCQHVERYIRFRYRKNDMDLNEITPEFVKDFEYFLKTERNCAHNTATKYLKNFKKITRIALANKWMKDDPFRNTKFRLDEVDMDFLTEDELNTMMQRKFDIERLQQVKDVYLFCCFTGLAFVDVKSLSYSDIVDNSGKQWIKKRRQKTKNWCNIPLMEPAIQLMNKYKSHPACQKKGLVFPVLTNQKITAHF